MDERAIGVFDSGAGGLTAVRQLQTLLPGEHIVYFGDTGRVPYGTRSPETIIQYTKQDIRFLISKNVKLLLAACGTISSTLPPDYSAGLPVPYFGVVEAAANAAASATCTGRIGVIGTPATIHSGSYERRLRQLLPHAEVFTQSCPMFVPLVENGYVDPENPITTAVAQEYLAAIKTAGVDVLILGCTHYPLISPILQRIMGPEVTLIDPGREGALITRQFLQSRGLLTGNTGPGHTDYYVSDVPQGFEASIQLFVGPAGTGPVNQIAIENY